MRTYKLFFLVICFVISGQPLAAQVNSQKKTPSWSDLPDRWWNNAVANQLKSAAGNRDQIAQALNQIEIEHRGGMAFLVEHMPTRDLKSLSSDVLLNNVRLAYQAREQAPWGKQIPDDIFLNDVLPYANVDEPREGWRSKMQSIAWPIVKDCKTASDAAQKLNEQLFQKIGVRYSTGRKRANQAPSESIEQGVASCTGLSILLTDACRSVSVPARLAGIPSWPNKRGNHTWVEIWDESWHFTGAAEPNPKGLNHTWFQRDAALAKKNSPLNAIYAVSFKRTGTTFPLVWSANDENPIYAVNVTDRYTGGKQDESAQENTTAAMFRVWNEAKTERRVAKIRLTSGEHPSETFAGQSRNNQADMNDMLMFHLRQNHVYQMEIDDEGLSGRL